MVEQLNWRTEALDQFALDKARQDRLFLLAKQRRQQDTRPVKQKLRKILRHLGLRFSTRINPPQWNGRTMWDAVLEAGGDFRLDWPPKDCSEVCHEIAHYLVASPRRRRLPNYGLGEPPGDDTPEAPVTVSPRTGVQEEMMASCLGILLERSLGLARWRDTFMDHSWPIRDSKETKLSTVGRKLQRRGLLVGATPKIVLEVLR